MELFIIKEGKVTVTPEALLIPEFNNIWEQNDQGMAIIKLSYVEFMCSYKKTNPFVEYSLDDRPDKILASILPNGTDEEKGLIKGDPLVLQARTWYTNMMEEAAVSIRFYNSAVNAAESMIEFFDNVDLSQKTKTGALLYKPADITRALKEVNDVIKTLNAMKEQVFQELSESAKGKGGRTINHFERPRDQRTK